jgi:thiol-disulfide isomerase/thioredoxin
MAQGKYTVQGETKADFAGKIYIMDYFARKIVDSTEVVGGKFTFSGNIETPIFAMVNSRQAGLQCPFILEPGNAIITQNQAAGTPMNDELKKLLADMQAISDGPEAKAQYKALIEGVMKNHTNDALGLVTISQFAASVLETSDIIALVETCGPFITESAVVKQSMTAWQAQAKTAPGMMFTDFEVEYEGKIQKLSDYVGKGKYVLVDFWASWCGPCKRAMPGIKELYAKYKGDKFEVLGVATWDKPEATLKAIEELQLPWPQIINAQYVGSNAYGVQGIPQIILFAPDGKIVARDLHGDALKAAVEKAMNE